MTAACPDPTELEALATGRAALSERRALEQHLDTCPACSAVVAELARLYATGVVSRASGALAPAASYGALAAAPAAAQPPAGATEGPLRLGRYVLGERLGAGGMGVVFAAYDPELDRRVAVKLLHPDPSGDLDAQRARLQREAQAMAKLSHPNVVAVYDVGRVGEQLFVAMELVIGETLTRWLRGVRRSRETVLGAFLGAGRGLEAAHGVGLVHRDFKPDNVLIAADGRARVTDFGLARPLAHSPGAGVGALGVTAAGTLVGTPAYMAPEQLLGRPADARSDQFSFCVALYEALYGERPFAGVSLRELANNVLTGRLRPAPAGAPRWLRQLLARGLSPRPEARFASMGELLAELARDRGRVRRLGLAGVGMAAGVAATVGVLQALALRTPARPALGPLVEGSVVAAPACASASAALESRWGEARREEVRKALDRYRSLYGGGRGEAGVRALDAYAEAWGTARRRACEQGGEQAGPRAACLSERRRAFEALVARLARADGVALPRAPSAIDALPALAPCESERPPAPPTPADAQAAARLALVRDELASARAAGALGALHEAETLAAGALERAGPLGDAALLADARLAVGQLAEARGDIAIAREQLTEAAALARSAAHDEAASRAALSLVHVAGAEALRPDEGERWLRLAAEVERPGDEAARAELALAEGSLRLAEGRFADAREAFSRSLTSARAAEGERGAAVGHALAALANAHLALDEPADALSNAEQAERLFSARGGNRDVRAAETLAVSSRALVALGRPAEAIERYARVESVRGEAYSLNEPNAPDYAEGRAAALEALGRGDEARLLLEKHASSRETLAPGLPHARARLALGSLLARQRRGREGVRELRRALSLFEEAYGRDDPRLTAPLRALAAAQSLAGDAPGALATLGRARRTIEAHLGFVSAISAGVFVDMGDAAERVRGPRPALALFDEAFLPLGAAYGHKHPRVEANVLRRAELAHRLGDEAEARRLYGAVAPPAGSAPPPEDIAGALRARLRELGVPVRP